MTSVRHLYVTRAVAIQAGAACVMMSAALVAAPLRSAAVGPVVEAPQAAKGAASAKKASAASPTVAPPVSVPLIVVKPDADWPFADAVPGPAGDVKTWGGLAALPGTTWTIGKDEIVSIAWVEPGKVMRIRRAGLYGRRETVIRADADGKLSYGHANYGANTLDEGSAAPSKSRVTLLNTTVAQIECRDRKGSLECERRSWQGGKAQGFRVAGGLFTGPPQSQGGKWQSAGEFVLTPTDQASARALIAAMPREFPDWPAGTFDPRLGVLDAMNGRDWYVVAMDSRSADDVPNNGRAVVTLGSTGGDQDLLIVGARPDTTLVLTGAKGGSFAGTTEDSREKDPERRAPIDFQVMPGGAVRLCTASFDVRTCDDWRLSRDGRTAWTRRTTNTGYSDDYLLRTPDLSAAPDGDFGILSRLVERYYTDASGNYLYVYAFNGGIANVIEFYRPDFTTSKLCYMHSKTCTIIAPGSMFDPGGGGERTERPAKFAAIGDDAFDLDGQRYRVTGDKIQVSAPTAGASVSKTYTPISFVDWRLRRLAVADAKAVQLSRSNRLQTQQANRAFWANLNQRIQNMDVSQITRNNPAFAPPPMIMAGPSQPGMGRMIHIKPAYDAAAQARTDELERFAIRERLYAESRGGAPLRNDGPGSQADLQRKLDRLAAESDRKQAEMDRAFAADRAADDRQRAADAASEQQEKTQREARQAATDQTVKARDAADRAERKTLNDRARASDQARISKLRAAITVNDDAADRAEDAARQAGADRLRRLNDQQRTAAAKAEADVRAGEQATIERAKNRPALTPCGGKGQRSCRATQQ